MRIFGDYMGFDPKFMKKVAFHLSKIFDISSTVFVIRYPVISYFFKKPQLIKERLGNIIQTLPKQRVGQLLEHYGISPRVFWNSYKKA